MNLRREPTYISTEVWRALWLISRRWECTPDEVADQLLKGALEDDYPEVMEHRNRVTTLEREIIGKIKPR